MSESTLRQELRKNDISWRSDMTYEQIEDLVEQNNTGLLGCRMMTARLRLLTGSNISRAAVQFALSNVDPEGVAARTRRRLQRRTYDVPGSNYMWHFDGHDKLSRYFLVQ
jgi:hypothetical protein